MNILNTLRRPYFGFFLSLLILFSSCHNSIKYEELEILTVGEFVEKHLSLTNEIIEIYTNEDNIKMEVLSKSPSKFYTSEEFSTFLKKANFSKSSQVTLIRLNTEIQNNTNNFLKNNTNFSQEKIIKKINTEINNQFDNNDSGKINLLSKASDVCGENFIRARSRCSRNYAIGVAALAVSAFFTFGIGTAIGAGAVMAQGALCFSDASSDFDSCRENSK